ncbi:MAG: aminotransferase class I/II-fold pyridoxal phosphate-dependent enzyme [Treponema sp.]|nr:aminotransferase class I/II-fold pyridoxal phosphate-dependent enzyme [Treponema sp.]
MHEYRIIIYYRSDRDGIMQETSTDIWALERYTNSETFFISGWDKEPTIMNLSTPIIAESARCFKNKQNLYYYMTENDELKNHFFTEVINTCYIKITVDNLSIAPNGTSGLFLSILSLKSKFKISNVIIISPTYFSITNVVKMLDMNLFQYQANIFDNDNIDFDELKKKIIINSIELIIITDPLFGTGVSINDSDYVNILNLVKELNIWLIIDYTYGGMEWEKPVTIINELIVGTIIEHPKTIVVETISKRLFLNGIKFAIVFSNPEIIKIIENLSESFIGSFSYVQNELFKRIYTSLNAASVIKQIEKNIEHIKLTFESIKSVIIGKNAFLSNCVSGYFVLMGIPVQRLNCLSDMEAAFAIIDKVNVFTIPHSRYHFVDNDYYHFRINLSMDRTQLIRNMNKLSDAYLY